MMRNVTVSGLFVAAVALATLVAPGAALAGGGGGGGPCAGFGDGDTVVLLDNCFDAVAHGSGGVTELTVTNEGQLPHTYTAVDGSFDTGELAPGETATVTVDADGGTIPVYCTLHGTAQGDGMAGLLLAGATASGDAAPAVPAANVGGVGWDTADSATVALLATILAIAVVILRRVATLAPAGSADDRAAVTADPPENVTEEAATGASDRDRMALRR